MRVRRARTVQPPFMVNDGAPRTAHGRRPMRKLFLSLAFVPFAAGFLPAGAWRPPHRRRRSPRRFRHAPLVEQVRYRRHYAAPRIYRPRVVYRTVYRTRAGASAPAPSSPLGRRNLRAARLRAASGHLLRRAAGHVPPTVYPQTYYDSTTYYDAPAYYGGGYVAPRVLFPRRRACWSASRLGRRRLGRSSWRNGGGWAGRPAGGGGGGWARAGGGRAAADIAIADCFRRRGMRPRLSRRRYAISRTTAPIRRR